MRRGRRRRGGQGQPPERALVAALALVCGVAGEGQAGVAGARADVPDLARVRVGARLVDGVAVLAVLQNHQLRVWKVGRFRFDGRVRMLSAPFSTLYLVGLPEAGGAREEAVPLVVPQHGRQAPRLVFGLVDRRTRVHRIDRVGLSLWL